MDRKLLIPALMLIAVSVHAIDINKYYSDLDGKAGNNLIDAIKNTISSHTVLSYNDVRADRSGVDYNAQGYVWDMYSNCSFQKSDYCTGTDFNDCDCYNREHSLPKSWWGSSQSEPMYTDLHHVIPTDGNANTQRSAWAFDNVKSVKWSNSAGAKQGTGMHISGDVFEVPDQYKGDFARIYFYMITCYNNKNFCQGGKGSQYFTYSGGRAGFTNVAANILLLWANGDPVSDKEINRNNKVYNKQGNRNPFVDLPDLYDYIWGTKKGKVYHLPTALDDVEEQYTYTVTTEGLTLNVSTTEENNMLAVYNMLGQVIYMQPVGVQQTRIEVPQAGIYLVRVGNQAKKVQVAY